MTRNFELEKMRYEREQMKIALDKASGELNLKVVKKLVEALALEPADIKELQSKTSQLPNLYKDDTGKHAEAKALADYVNKLVAETKADKTDSQNSFLTSRLTDSKSDDVK